MSFSYILSVKRLLLSFGALYARESGPSCPIMMHHHQTNILLESVGCSRTQVPESISELNERHYILTYVQTKAVVVSVPDVPHHLALIRGNLFIVGKSRLIYLPSPLIPSRSVYGLA